MKLVKSTLAVGLATENSINAAWCQSLPPGVVWSYGLINGSLFVDDCPVCDRATIAIPMRGTFELRFRQQGPLFSTYAIDNISFAAAGNGSSYKITGRSERNIIDGVGRK